MCDLGCVSAPPTLLHLALMVDEDDGEFSGQKTNTCLTLLSHLLPELCYEIEIPDHLGNVICTFTLYIYTYVYDAPCISNGTHLYMHKLHLLNSRDIHVCTCRWSAYYPMSHICRAGLNNQFVIMILPSHFIYLHVHL